MSTIKLSDLPLLSQLDANSSNSLFVVINLPDGANGTKIITGHSLAQGLYANESLNVGNVLLVSGNVGLGITNPTSRLQVLGTTTSNTFYSTVATGTAPFTVLSTTPVSNLVANTVVTNANLTGEVTSIGNQTVINNANVINKVLTGYVSAPGVITASDTILSAIQKANGNITAANTSAHANDALTFITLSSLISAANTSAHANDAILKTFIDAANTAARANDVLTFITLSSSISAANTSAHANDALLSISLKSYTDAANTFLRANDALTFISLSSLITAANTSAHANDALVLANSMSYTDSTNTAVQSIAFNASKAYTDVMISSLNTLAYNWVFGAYPMTSAKTYTDAANTSAHANDAIVLSTAKSYTDAANTYLASLINYPLTNKFYVDPSRTDTYTATGSLNKPFKSVSSALTYIHAGIDNSSITSPDINPIFVVLKGSTTESFTLSRGHIFLVGEDGNEYTNIGVNGTITINGSNNSTSALDSNYFVVSGLSINAGTNNVCIQTSGANAQSVFVKDISIYASGTGTGIYANNSGVRVSDGKSSFIQGSDVRVNHTGTGDVYCFNIVKGNAIFSQVETINTATQIGAVQDGASLKFVNSQLQSNGNTCVESYGTGLLTVFNSSIINTQITANSYGVWLHNSGSTAVLDQCYFDISDTTHSGSRAVKGVSGSVLSYSNLSFAANSTLGSTNNLLDSSVTYNLLTNSFTRV